MSSIPTKQIDGDVAVGRNVSAGGDVNIQGFARIGHDLKVEGWLEAKNIKSANKGLFVSATALRTAYPQPHDGWFAMVGVSSPFETWIADGGLWKRAVDENGNQGVTNIVIESQQIQELVNDLSVRIDSIEKQTTTTSTKVSTLLEWKAYAEQQISTANSNIASIRLIIDALEQTDIESMITDRLNEVIPLLTSSFDGIIGSANVQLQSVAATDPTIVWIENPVLNGKPLPYGTFAAAYVGDKYYANWLGSRLATRPEMYYANRLTLEPHADKIYRHEDNAFVFNKVSGLLERLKSEPILQSDVEKEFQ